MKKIILIAIIGCIIFGAGTFVGHNIETVTEYEGTTISVQ